MKIRMSCALFALLATQAACTGTTTAVPPASNTGVPSVERAGARSARPQTHASYIEPNAKDGALLYIADYAASAVQIYSYPSAKPVGMLSGLSHPEGMCVDAAANIWITSTGSSQITEYAHGATKPTKTLSDPGYFPVSCAVNPKTGDLVVGNVFSTRSDGPGSLVIYKNATGTPSFYNTRSAGFFSIYFVAFDPSGNLFFDGTDAQPSDGQFVYGEVPRNAKNVKPLALTGAFIGFPGNVQWDGKQITVGDQDGSLIYRTKGAKITGSTALSGPLDVVGYWIDGKTVIAPDSENGNAGYFRYPAGGPATKLLTGFSDPISAAVSPGRR
jgi:hypothetical protein